MKKVLIWYLDTNNDTRLEMVDLTHGYQVQTLLYEFSQKPEVKVVIEAFTVAEIHSIEERTWTEGFDVKTEVVLDEQEIVDREDRNKYERKSWEERRD